MSLKSVRDTVTALALVGCAPAHEGVWRSASGETTLIIEDDFASWTYFRQTTNGPLAVGPLTSDWAGPVAKTGDGVTLALTCNKMETYTGDPSVNVEVDCRGRSSTVPCTLDEDTLSCAFDSETTVFVRD